VARGRPGGNALTARLDAEMVQTWVMPTTDEDLLIDAAVSQRKSHKRGADLLATFTVAAIFAAVGWFLVFWLRPLIKSLWFLPLGTVTTTLLIIGVIAFAIAGLLYVPAVRQARPAAREGRIHRLAGRPPRGRRQEGAPRHRDLVPDPRLLLRRRHGHHPKDGLRPRTDIPNARVAPPACPMASGCAEHAPARSAWR
jgi:hypothetical protein